MQRRWTHATLWLGALLVLRPTSVAACESYSACVAQMQQASQARDYAGAQRAAEGAYRYQPDPILILNLGGFHQKQGHRAEAIAAFERYLSSGDPSLSPALRADIERRLSLLHKPVVSAPPAAPPPPAAAPTTVAPPLAAVLKARAVPVERRPLGWLFYGGVSLTVVGLTLTGLGAAALAVDGQCALDATPCTRVYDSRGQGLGLLIPGLAAVGAGVTLFSVALARRPLRSPDP